MGVDLSLFGGARQGRPGLMNPDDPEQPREQTLSPLERFFGGNADPSLSPQANEAAASQAMTLAGLQIMLGANPRSGPAGNLANLIASGALAGQQAGAAARQQAAMQQVRQQVGELLTSGQISTRQDMESAILQLAAVGAVDEAKLLVDILKQRPGPAEGAGELVQVVKDGKMRFVKRQPDGTFQLLRGQGQDVPSRLAQGQPVEVKDEFGRSEVAFLLENADLQKVEGPGGTTQFVDPGEGEVVSEFVGPGDEVKEGVPTEVFDPRVGRNVLAVFRMGQFVDLQGNPIPNAEPKVTIPAESRAFASQALPSLEANLNRLKQFEQAPSEVEAFLGRGLAARLGGRRLVGTDAEQYFAAGDQLIALVVRIISGAQASDAEREALFDAFVPQAGESREVFQTKIDRLDDFVQGARDIAAGRINSPAAENARRQLNEALIGASSPVGSGGAEGGPVVDEDNPFSDLVPK